MFRTGPTTLAARIKSSICHSNFKEGGGAKPAARVFLADAHGGYEIKKAVVLDNEVAFQSEARSILAPYIKVNCYDCDAVMEAAESGKSENCLYFISIDLLLEKKINLSKKIKELRKHWGNSSYLIGLSSRSPQSLTREIIKAGFDRIIKKIDFSQSVKNALKNCHVIDMGGITPDQVIEEPVLVRHDSADPPSIFARPITTKACQITAKQKENKTVYLYKLASEKGKSSKANAPPPIEGTVEFEKYSSNHGLANRILIISPPSDNNLRKQLKRRFSFELGKTLNEITLTLLDSAEEQKVNIVYTNTTDELTGVVYQLSYEERLPEVIFVYSNPTVEISGTEMVKRIRELKKECYIIGVAKCQTDPVKFYNAGADQTIFEDKLPEFIRRFFVEKKEE
ncbi:hypothetical protein ACFL52_00650 [Candidatus Margulisiibacteriota bacterium]